jgi:hypothetical protein
MPHYIVHPVTQQLFRPVGATDASGCEICTSGVTPLFIGTLLGAIAVFGLQELFRMKTAQSAKRIEY